MNSSGIWLRDNNKQQLPTPVILPETFVEHKKTLLNSPCDLFTSIMTGGPNHPNRYASSVAILKTRATTSCVATRRLTLSGSKTGAFRQKHAFSPPPSPLNIPFNTISNSANNDRSPQFNCTHCLLHRPPNTFSGPSLNTPCASRCLPYKRFKDYDFYNGPLNLSKNELDTSMYDNRKELRFIDQCFNLNCVLDTGTFSEVYHAQSKIDGQFYAIKVVNLVQKHHFMFKYNEVLILDHISPTHPNIIHFYSAWREFDYMFIKTELCLDNFSNLLVIQRIEERELLIFLAHALSGLQHIHSFNIIHMDIKSSNILLGLDGYYKLADFGLATFLSRRENKNSNVTEGDSRYMAIELLNNIVSPSVDIFSLGMTLVEAIFNINLPKDGCLWHRLRQGYLPSHDYESVDYSTQLYTYTKQMITADPDLRPTPQELLQWNELAQVLTFKSTYLDLLKPQYEACVTSKINSSESFCSPNNYSHATNNNEVLTCSTPMLYLPSPIKKSRLISKTNSDEDVENIDSDVIELNFSD